MTPPINIDGESGYSNVTIDGQTVEEITVDGDVVPSSFDGPALLINAIDEGTTDYIEVIATENINTSNWRMEGYFDGSSDFTWTISDTASSANAGDVIGDDESNNGVPSVGFTQNKAWYVELIDPNGNIVDSLGREDEDGSSPQRGGNPVLVNQQTSGNNYTYYRTVDDDTDSTSDWDHEQSPFSSKNQLNPGQTGNF